VRRRGLLATLASAAVGAVVLPTAAHAQAPATVGAPDTAAVELRPLRPGVWLHTTYYRYPDGTRVPSNGLVVRDGDGLLLVDTAWGEQLTAALLARIDREIGLTIRRAVVTHAHGDRLAGADVLRGRGIPVWSLPATQRLALASGMPVPGDTLGGLAAPGSARAWGTVELFYPGPGHAPDNLMVWLPTARVLFGGCAVRGATTTTLGNVAHADLTSWPVALRRAADRYPSADIVVPGHAAPGGRELLAHSIALLEHR